MMSIGVLTTLVVSAIAFQLLESEFALRTIRWTAVETTSLIAPPLIATGMMLIVGGFSLTRR